MSMTADDLGKIVHMVMADYCKQTGRYNIKLWEELPEWDNELTKRIGVEIYNTVSAEQHEEISDMKERLFRAEQALELLDAIMPEKVRQAKEIAAGIDYDNTLGGHCQQLADGIDKIRNDTRRDEKLPSLKEIEMLVSTVY